MITHLTLSQSQVKCTIQPRWDRAPRKQAIADRKSEKLKRQRSQAITLPKFNFFFREQICQPFKKDISAATHTTSG